jgi:hypothetical protein
LKPSLFLLDSTAFCFAEKPTMEPTVERQLWMEGQGHPFPVKNANGFIA